MEITGTQSYENVGRWLGIDSASALLSVGKVESYHTGLLGSRGYPFSQSTETLCSPHMGVCAAL